jgi:hypothetical protein
LPVGGAQIIEIEQWTLKDEVDRAGLEQRLNFILRLKELKFIRRDDRVSRLCMNLDRLDSFGQCGHRSGAPDA